MTLQDLSPLLLRPLLLSAIFATLVFAAALLLPRPSTSSALTAAFVGGAVTAVWAILVMLATSGYVSGEGTSFPDTLMLVLMFGLPAFVAGVAAGLLAYVAICSISLQPRRVERYLLLVLPPLTLLVAVSCIAFASIMWATG